MALGASGSGLIFHQHGFAVNALFSGAKRWLIHRKDASEDLQAI